MDSRYISQKTHSCIISVMGGWRGFENDRQMFRAFHVVQNRSYWPLSNRVGHKTNPEMRTRFPANENDQVFICHCQVNVMRN